MNKYLLLTALLLAGCSPDKQNQPSFQRISPSPSLDIQGSNITRAEGVTMDMASDGSIHIKNDAGKKPDVYGCISIPINSGGKGEIVISFKAKALNAEDGSCEFNIRSNWSNHERVESGSYDWKDYTIHFVSHGEKVLFVISENLGEVWIKDLKLEVK